MGTRFIRKHLGNIVKRLTNPPDFVQIVVGARQVGKTTIAVSIAGNWEGPVFFEAADNPIPPGHEWIIHHWETARRAGRGGRPLLVIDEIQKVAGWGESVKSLWDADRAKGGGPAVLLLGSSALLVTKGSAESLAGRFFLHRLPHWSFSECREAFGWDLDRWLYFGGYPGAAALADDEASWRSYVNDSLVESVLAKDVVALQTIAKPALLRQLFALASRYAAEILSYNKMLGQLQDAGNTTTLAHYLRLLETAFLVSGLERFTLGTVRAKGSSPKLVLWNNALVTAAGLRTFAQARSDHAVWGRLVENAVGAHLLNNLAGLAYEIAYWREREDEVDYIVRSGDAIWGVEVKSGRPRTARGLAPFLAKFPQARPFIAGSGGMPLEEFFGTDPKTLFTA
ncbi:MAG: ATP-binding protein [Deltaproteobacteria bacterium]|nr:ATP-binding protein [Deltaproteobacteria bacterium]